MSIKNLYSAVILICSQIYMLLYDVKASFGLMDLFIICLFYYLLMKRKICLKGLCCILGLLVTGIVLCSMFHPSNIFKNRYCNDPCADIFHCKQLFCVLQKAEQGSLYKNGYIHNEHD